MQLIDTKLSPVSAREALNAFGTEGNDEGNDLNKTLPRRHLLKRKIIEAAAATVTGHTLFPFPRADAHVSLVRPSRRRTKTDKNRGKQLCVRRRACS